MRIEEEENNCIHISADPDLYITQVWDVEDRVYCKNMWTSQDEWNEWRDADEAEKDEYELQNSSSLCE